MLHLLARGQRRDGSDVSLRGIACQAGHVPACRRMTGRTEPLRAGRTRTCHDKSLTACRAILQRGSRQSSHQIVRKAGGEHRSSDQATLRSRAGRCVDAGAVDAALGSGNVR